MSFTVRKSFDEFIHRPLPQKVKLLELFNTGDHLTVFDIGCCEGEDTLRYLKLFPNSHIHAFEALPDNYNIATSNINQYNAQDSVTINQLALSDKNGTAEFYVSTGAPEEAKNQPNWDFGNKSSSLLPPDKTLEVTPWLEFHKKITVETKKLDDYCEENNIGLIDLMHIDVQGAELMVLNGASEMLTNIKAIWLEVEAIELYKGQPLKKDVENFMKKHGFVKKLDTVNDIAGDQLYIRENLQ